MFLAPHSIKTFRYITEEGSRQANNYSRKRWNSYRSSLLRCNRRIYERHQPARYPRRRLSGRYSRLPRRRFPNRRDGDVCTYVQPLIVQRTHISRAKLINNTLAACPNTPLLLSGYSQGAQLVHQAAASLPAKTTAKISSVILFGDPKNGTAIQGIAADKVLTICHSGMLRL